MSAKSVAMEMNRVKEFTQGCSIESQTKVRTYILIYFDNIV